MVDADRYVGIDELYTSYDMKLNGVETIYLIESYMKTLPDTLPAELRRSIILKRRLSLQAYLQIKCKYYNDV